MASPMPTSRIATVLAVAASIAYFGISSQLLAVLEIPYDYPGGNPISKFHPGTYLCILAFCVMAAGPSSPFFSHRLFLKFSYLMAFLLVTSLIAMINLLRFGPSGLAFYVDTLIAPVLLSFILLNTPNHVKIRLFYFLIWFLVINSGIAAIEFVLRERLIPFTIGGQIEIKQYFRATALLGHPLANASATALALPAAVFLSPNRLARVVTVFMFLLALLAYGGRMALAFSILALVFMGFVVTARDLLTGRFTDRRGIVLVLGIFVIPSFILALLFLTNFGDRFLGQLYWDGSAQTRLDTLSIIPLLRTSNLIWGVPIDDMEFLKESLLDGRTIESSWVLLILRMGLVAFVPFMCTFLLIFWRFWHVASIEGKIAILMFLFFVSAGPTLAVKSSKFAIFVIILHCSAAAARAQALQKYEKQKVTIKKWTILGKTRTISQPAEPRF